MLANTQSRQWIYDVKFRFMPTFGWYVLRVKTRYSKYHCSGKCVDKNLEDSSYINVAFSTFAVFSFYRKVSRAEDFIVVKLSMIWR